MSFAAYWWRASTRRRWRALVGVTLLLGIIGGLSLFAIAGARRTQSAYPRFLRSTNPSTMAVNMGDLTPESREAMAKISRLPQVVQVRPYTSFYTAVVIGDEPDFSQEFETLGSIDGRYFDQDIFTPTSGRRPDPARPDEIAVNELAARSYGYEIGQQLDLATISEAQLEEEALEPALRGTATIVGIGLFIEEVVQDDTDRSPLMLLTPAFVEEAKGLETYAWLGIILRNGDADVAAVKEEVGRLTGLATATLFRVTSTDTFHALQSIRPVSIALGTFGAIAGLAAIALVSQSLGRHLRSEREELATARAIGASPRALVAAASVGPALAIVAGVTLAAVVAFVASPAMPIGPVSKVEVGAGFDVDWTVLGLGSLGLALVLLGLLAAAGWREAPHRVQRRSTASRPPRSRLSAVVANLPVPAATGLRLAFESGQGATAVPVRSVMAGAAVAVTALVAAITFGASLQRLVSNPSLYGWNWDVALVAEAGYGNTKLSATNELIGNDPDVAGWSGAYFGSDTVDGRNLPLLGMDPGSEVRPPIRAGRMVERPAEIVLGTATIEQLGKRIGDTVMSSSGPWVIVGTATLPTLGQVHGDHTSLGIGGLVETTTAPGWDNGLESQNPDPAAARREADYGGNVLFIRFREGADKAAVTARLEGMVPEISPIYGGFVAPVLRPAEIVNSDDIGGSPTLLGIAVAVSALASLWVALTAAVRRRRRDLAVLKSIGFTRWQLSAAVSWQATATVAVGLLIGAPLGVALGRTLWNQFADQLDVVASPTVPALGLALVVAAAFVAANAIAALPARYVRAVPAALVLRTE